MTANVVVERHLGKRALQLPSGQVEGIVVNTLPGCFKGLQQKIDLAEISGKN
jgi:hypothetical protein